MNTVEESPFSAMQRRMQQVSSDSSSDDLKQMRRRSKSRRSGATEVETHMRSVESEGIKVTQGISRQRHSYEAPRRSRDGSGVSRQSVELREILTHPPRPPLSPTPPEPSLPGQEGQRTSFEGASSQGDASAKSVRTSEEEGRHTVKSNSGPTLTMSQMRDNDFGGYRSQAAQANRAGNRRSQEMMRRRHSRDLEVGSAYASSRGASSGEEELPSTRVPSLNITINQGNMGQTSQELPHRSPRRDHHVSERHSPRSPHMEGVFWGLGPRLDVESMAYKITVGCIKGLLYVVLGGGGIVLTGTVIHTIVRTENGGPGGSPLAAPSPF